MYDINVHGRISKVKRLDGNSKQRNNAPGLSLNRVPKTFIVAAIRKTATFINISRTRVVHIK